MCIPLELPGFRSALPVVDELLSEEGADVLGDFGPCSPFLHLAFLH